MRKVDEARRLRSRREYARRDRAALKAVLRRIHEAHGVFKQPPASCRAERAARVEALAVRVQAELARLKGDSQ